MINLLYKDMIITSKKLILGILISFVLTIMFIFEHNTSQIMIICLNFMYILPLFLGQSCYLDEKDRMMMYLKILPFNEEKIVLSKFINAYIVIVLSVFIFYLNKFLFINHINKSMIVSFNYILILISSFIVYTSIYLFLYFKYNYNASKNSLIIIFIFGLVFYKICSVLNINIDTIVLIKLKSCILILALFLSFLFYRLSVIAFKNKQI